MKHIITGTNIKKSFGKEKDKSYVLNGVDVSIAEGEFTAVMGPSGCGKTTLLFALSGMDEIDSGSVRFADAEISSLNENQLADLRRTRMGFVFQQPTMLANLNLLDNIILPSMQGNHKSSGEIVSKAEALMAKTGIRDLCDRDITEVSGGQLQRAGICRALMSTPDILFADEPTGALNSKSAEEIMDLFSEINKEGTAVFLVTHDAKIAARADRVIFMKDGSVKSELRFDKFTPGDLDARVEKIAVQMRRVSI